jgi:hypothetical protein
VADAPIVNCPFGDGAARLNDALVRGFESIKAERFRAAAAIIADLRRR